MKVDPSFAALALSYLERPSPSLRTRLLAHPAIQVLKRHAALAGRTVSPDSLLKEILGEKHDSHAVENTLAAWAGRDRELIAAATEALFLLPGGYQMRGTIYFEVGYDIGVAVPPVDLAINVANHHFRDNPEEIAFYVTHEAHHLGFFAIRRPPSLLGLNAPGHLLEIVKYFTQLEGMAVHAAYRSRQRANALGPEEDYRVYNDPNLRAAVIKRYAQCLGKIEPGAVSEEIIGEVLTAMSSGERLWYRFGAVVANEIETVYGRDILIDTISSPERWLATVNSLLGPKHASTIPTDQERAKWNVPPLSEARKRADAMNATEK